MVDDEDNVGDNCGGSWHRPATDHISHVHLLALVLYRESFAGLFRFLSCLMILMSKERAFNLSLLSAYPLQPQHPTNCHKVRIPSAPNPPQHNHTACRATAHRDVNQIGRLSARATSSSSPHLLVLLCLNKKLLQIKTRER